MPELAVSAEDRGRGFVSAEPDNPSRFIYERAGFTHTAGSGGSWTMVVDL